MSIRKLALATVVVAGVLAFAGKADAQVIYTSGYYTSPTVYSSYYAPAPAFTPTVTYSSWSIPSYNGWYWDGYGYSNSYSYPYYSGYYRSYPAYYGRRGLRGWRW